MLKPTDPADYWIVITVAVASVLLNIALAYTRWVNR